MAMNRFSTRLRQTLVMAVMAGFAFGAQAKIGQVRFAVDPTYPPFESKTPQGSRFRYRPRKCALYPDAGEMRLG